MKFLIDRASFGPEVRKPCEEARKLANGGYGVKLNSLDDLIELVKSIGSPIIIYGPNGDHSLPFLSIYDGYIE